MNEGNRPNRAMLERFVRSFLRASVDEVGAFSLNMLLRKAGVVPDRALSPNERMIFQVDWEGKREMTSSDYASIVGIIRDYYGTGARGSLNRIGRRTWQGLVREATVGQRLSSLALRAMSPAGRSLRSLEYLAARLSHQPGDVTVHPQEPGILLVDRISDATYGQQADGPICWITQGMIQEALLWVQGEEAEVEEIACRAAGAPACTFDVRIAEATEQIP